MGWRRPFYHWACTFGLSTLFYGQLAYVAVSPITRVFAVFDPGRVLSILGERAGGWSAHIIDILAGLCDAVSLGHTLASWRTAVRNAVFNLPIWARDFRTNVQCDHFIFWSRLSRLCIRSGDGSGRRVKVLSEVNMGVGDPVSFSSSFLQGRQLIGLSGFWTGLTAYTQERIPLSKPLWPHGWTPTARGGPAFYWRGGYPGRLSSGIVIARVSTKGALCGIHHLRFASPSLIIFVWMGVFGGIAIGPRS